MLCDHLLLKTFCSEFPVFTTNIILLVPMVEATKHFFNTDLK